MRYIGDVHGNMGNYLAITDGCANSTQVGDFGMGFVEVPEIPLNHRFIRGNHDNPALCKTSPNWIPDATVEGDAFYCGGAYSIDWSSRTKDVDAWVDEELSYSAFNDAINIYEKAKPRIVISHDAPDAITTEMFMGDMRYGKFNTRTGLAFQTMLDIHQPELWIFGHWHIDMVKKINHTRFICLDEFSFIDIGV